MEMGDVAGSAEALAGVRRTVKQGLTEWRYHGRLVARQLDDAHIVIRADFDYRDWLMHQFPETFSVPTRYIKHMMVVADLARGDAVPSRMPSKKRGSFGGRPTSTLEARRRHPKGGHRHVAATRSGGSPCVA